MSRVVLIALHLLSALLTVDPAMKTRVNISSPKVERRFLHMESRITADDFVSHSPINTFPTSDVNVAECRHLLDLEDDRDDIFIGTSLPTAKGTIRSRVSQTYMGLRVFGVSCTVEYGSTGHPTGNAFGHVIKGINKDISSTDTALTDEDALNLLKSANHPDKLSYDLGKEDAEKVIYVDDDGNSHVCWYVYYVAYSPDGFNDSKPTAIIDGNSAEILDMWDGLDTLQVKVAVGNSIDHTSKQSYDIEVLEAQPGICFYKNPKTELMDMQRESANTKWEFVVRGFPCEAALDYSEFDFVNSRYSPMNEAYLYSHYTYDMFNEYIGVSPLHNGTHSHPILLRVHINGCYDNAYWDGTYVNIGDGCYLYYPLTSLDIIAHEIGHGFTDNNADLKYKGQSGAIDESFSDIVGETAEYYFRQKTGTGTNDWKIGAGVQRDGKPMRYMDDPTEDRTSIDNVFDYYDGVKVHHASGVFNKAFSLLSNKPDWDIIKAFKVFARANQIEWEPNTTFHCAACGLSNAASDLGFRASDVDDILSSVGADCELCL